ncbi:Acyl-coenzyme A thioesterase 13-like protein [Drosera capensis]
MTAGDDTTAPATPSSPPEKIIVRGLQSDYVEIILGFFTNVWNAAELRESAKTKDFFSDLIRGLLKVDRMERGKVSCSFKVELPVTNFYKGLHGGAVAAVAERVATACAKTVVAEDKELFLGELSISYLAAAPMNAEVMVDASLVRSGRSITVVSVEFRRKETGKLVYTAHATFFNLPASKL